MTKPFDSDLTSLVYRAMDDYAAYCMLPGNAESRNAKSYWRDRFCIAAKALQEHGVDLSTIPPLESILLESE